MSVNTYVGVAVGKHTHTIVVAKKEPDQETENILEMYVANSYEGFEQIKTLHEKYVAPVVFIGNRRWATPMAYTFKINGIEPLYYAVSTERGSRGKIGNMAGLFIKGLNANIRPRFFLPQVDTTTGLPSPSLDSQASSDPTYRLAREYLAVTDHVRTLNHRIQDCMTQLFPEAVKAGTTEKVTKEATIVLPVPEPQPSELFGTKKMRPVLMNPDPFTLEFDSLLAPPAIKFLARQSLGRSIPEDRRRKNFKDHQGYLQEYQHHLALKEAKLAELKRSVADHPLVKMFEGLDTICVLVALIGWRTWPWRLLRRYSGLDVSVVDSKGKPRISRVRSEIRSCLFLLVTKSKKGKEAIENSQIQSKKLTAKERVLLYYLWKHGLRDK